MSNYVTYEALVHGEVEAHLIPSWERKRGVLVHSFKVFFLAMRICRERRELLELDDKALVDIGHSRADVDREASRGFFDISQERIDAMYQ